MNNQSNSPVRLKLSIETFMEEITIESTEKHEFEN